MSEDEAWLYAAKLEAAIARVRELHQIDWEADCDYERACHSLCAECYESWPCPTIAALDEEAT